MGSCVVLGFAVCCKPLDCLDNIGLSLSVPVTESVESQYRQMYRHGE